MATKRHAMSSLSGSASAAGRRLLYSSSLGSGMKTTTAASAAAAAASHQSHRPQQELQQIGRQWFNTSSSSAGAAAASSSSSSPMQRAIDSDFEDDEDHHQSPSTGTRVQRRERMKPYPRIYEEKLHVPSYIRKPPYADTGVIPYNPTMYDTIVIHDSESIDKMLHAGKVARKVLQDVACYNAVEGTSTEDIDILVHNALIEEYNVYPSPLNYGEFPKSICSSINDVICHGIPDSRKLQYGDIVSFDISCFTNNGVHGDNCATIIVGDTNSDEVVEGSNDVIETDWRGIPVKTKFNSTEEEIMIKQSRHLINTTRTSLYAAIDECVEGNCLTQIGAAIQSIASQQNLKTVTKYRGHGISSDFHIPPFVKHYANEDYLKLQPGMIFTIEPMLVESSLDDEDESLHADCYEWDSDGWTVATLDGSMSAQFEHTILIREDGMKPLILTEYE